MKRSWNILRHHLGIFLERLQTIAKIQSGYPISGILFKPWTFRVRSTALNPDVRWNRLPNRNYEKLSIDFIFGNWLKNYCIEVPLNGITSLPNIKIYQAVQKFLVGDGPTDRQTDRLTGDLISLPSFLESTLKTAFKE
jgi:hypothetical protein